MERKIHTQQADGTWKCTGYEVVQHIKSSAGDRNTYISSKEKSYQKVLQASWNQRKEYAQDTKDIHLCFDRQQSC